MVHRQLREKPYLQNFRLIPSLLLRSSTIGTLQASYDDLALAEPVLVPESLQLSPTFSIFRISGNGALEAERQVVGDILALSTPPFRSEIAPQRFPQA